MTLIFEESQQELQQILMLQNQNSCIFNEEKVIKSFEMFSTKINQQDYNNFLGLLLNNNGIVIWLENNFIKGPTI